MKVERVTADHLPALRALFDRASSTCFCRYWHFTGTKNEWLDRCANRPEENAAEMDHAVRSNDPTGDGLVAIEGDLVVGWMKLTPRAAVKKLRTLSVYRNLDLGDEATTFSVGCFLIDPNARDRGIARALVRAAPDFARDAGARAIEAYPRRSSEKLYPEEAWQGPERIFVEAAFDVASDTPPYPVYRKTL